MDKVSCKMTEFMCTYYIVSTTTLIQISHIKGFLSQMKIYFYKMIIVCKVHSVCFRQEMTYLMTNISIFSFNFLQKATSQKVFRALLRS